MEDHDPTRRTALKLLALLGVGATGGSGVAAARDGDASTAAGRDGDAQRGSGLYVALLRPQPDADTNAHGVAIVQERQGALKFAVNVVNLENAFMAHIHEDEVLGPIAVWLYEFETQGDQLLEGKFSGILDVGTITDDVIAEGRADDAESETVQDLLGKINAGDAFVNVHTEQYPSGAIAGRLVPFDPQAVMRRAGGSDRGM